MGMFVNVLETFEKDGYLQVRVGVDKAVNSPVLRFPIGTKLEEVGGSMSCPIYPNHMLKKDGTCGRAASCNAHKQRCPAR